MSIPKVIQKVEEIFTYPSSRSKFLMMFSGVVIMPLMMFVVIGSNPNIIGWPGRIVLLSFAITLLLFAGISYGFLKYNHSSDVGKGLSIYHLAYRLKK